MEEYDAHAPRSRQAESVLGNSARITYLPSCLSAGQSLLVDVLLEVFCCGFGVAWWGFEMEGRMKCTWPEMA